MTRQSQGSVVLLSGGIGGAKLALGLSRILRSSDLTIVANTGDDFEHLGLYVSPDLDTLMYRLAGMDNPQTGWGRRDETWTFMSALDALGGPTWFNLGDGDLAVHVQRTCKLRNRETLSAITSEFCKSLGVAPRLVPMSDDPVRTRLRTATGWMGFQDYFVGHRCEPVISEIAFEGAARAHATFLDALRDPALRAVVISPSNPFLSIDPILALPQIRDALATCAAPVIAVSPIINGQAVKGPTAKIMSELGLEVSAASVKRHYQGLIDAYIVEPEDAAACDELDMAVIPAPTLMMSLADRVSLAQTVLTTASACLGRL